MANISNEVLVEAIKAVDRELIADLWIQTKNFIAKQAIKYHEQLGGQRGVDVDDLVQQGYFALLAAVDAYDPAGGASFLHYFSFHLHRAFRECSGLRTVRDTADPVNSPISLNAPENDEQSIFLLDKQADPKDYIGDAEERLQREQLHAALEKALEDLTPDCAAAIRAKYYEGRTLKEAAAAAGCSPDQIRQRQSKGMRQLRNRARKNGLDQFIELQTPYYARVNFEKTGLSPVELAVIRRDEILKRLGLSHIGGKT